MQRFKQFMIKEFHHILRDPRTLVIIFGIPVIQILLFGYVITTEIKDAKIAIYDKSKDHITLQLTHKLLSSGYFKLAGTVRHRDQIETLFQKGNIKEVIVFETDFAEKLGREGSATIQIIGDASDPNTARILANYTQAIVQDFIREQQPLQKTPLIIVPQVRMLYNPELEGTYMFVPGIMALLLMLISAIMTSISIAREKEMGTMETLLVSPLRPAQIVIGKVIPYLLLAFINTVVIISLGNRVFGVPIRGSVILLLTEGLLFTITALSLGILISTVADNQQVAMMISMVGLMLPTVLLSGFIFPIENMPVILQWLSNIVPAKWFIRIIKNIMLKGTGIQYFWRETLILVLMTLLFIGISIKRFKIRLE